VAAGGPGGGGGAERAPAASNPTKSSCSFMGTNYPQDVALILGFCLVIVRFGDISVYTDRLQCHQREGDDHMGSPIVAADGVVSGRRSMVLG
jgi:hypothetical protein